MSNLTIKNAQLINEGKIVAADLLIKNGRIEKIAPTIDAGGKEIDAKGQYLMPGIVDDQVHFREPGLTHKSDLYTEPRAAVAGGTTSFMEMPNTKPAAVTQKLLQDKYDIAAKKSLANYSFFMGATNDNLEEVLKTDTKNVCGIKVFMGSSTGNMLVDNRQTLEQLFAKAPMLIATHCEDEATIRANVAAYKERYGENVPIECHPEIRNTEGCYKSSSMAIEMAKKFGTRLHILHISTRDELDLFSNKLPLKEKKITAEVCVHHLTFSKDDYAKYGAGIKCNPAVKESFHRDALWTALLDDRLDIIATDHAPHTMKEKAGSYFNSPSGVPLVQHSLNMMLEAHEAGKISLEKIVEKMCHAPTDCFRLSERGYLREGYWADLVLFDLDRPWKVAKDNLHYKCNWSPFEGHTFKSAVTHTFVNGHLAYKEGAFFEGEKGRRLVFEN